MIFLNDFDREAVAQVTARLERHPEFAELLDGGGNARRRALELKHLGGDLRRDLAGLFRELGLRFQFREAYLPKQHLEVCAVR